MKNEIKNEIIETPKYNNIFDAIKHKGIFIDNFGNKLDFAKNKINDQGSMRVSCYDDPRKSYAYVYIVAKNATIMHTTTLNPAEFGNNFKQFEITYGGDSKLDSILVVGFDKKKHPNGLVDNDIAGFKYQYADDYIAKLTGVDLITSIKNVEIYNNKTNNKQKIAKLNIPNNMWLSHILGEIDNIFYFPYTKANTVPFAGLAGFDTKGQLATKIDLSGLRIEKTPDALEELFNKIKTRYQYKLQHNDERRKARKVAISFGGYRQKVGDVIDEVLSLSTDAKFNNIKKNFADAQNDLNINRRNKSFDGRLTFQ